MNRYRKDFTNTIRILFLFFGISIGLWGCSKFQIKIVDPDPVTIKVIEESIPTTPFIIPTALHEFQIPTEEVEEKPMTEQEIYDSYVYEICKNYPRVNPETIRAIIYVESRYTPDVLSSSNCVGLMQISLKWHTNRARSLGVEDLYDPYGNILTGVDLFNDLLTNYADGDEVYAIMMYNMGHSGAKKLYQKGVVSSYALNVLERRALQKEESYA